MCKLATDFAKQQVKILNIDNVSKCFNADMRADKLIEIIGDYDENNTILSGGASSGDVRKFAEHLVKKINIEDVMPSLYQDIECVCGWKGRKGHLYFRECNKEFNIDAKFECPKCYTELVG
jgi:hypothetical protein